MVKTPMPKTITAINLVKTGTRKGGGFSKVGSSTGN
jgi:hypothetical protein